MSTLLVVAETCVYIFSKSIPVITITFRISPMSPLETHNDDESLKKVSQKQKADWDFNLSTPQCSLCISSLYPVLVCMPVCSLLQRSHASLPTIFSSVILCTPVCNLLPMTLCHSQHPSLLSVGLCVPLHRNLLPVLQFPSAILPAPCICPVFP